MNAPSQGYFTLRTAPLREAHSRLPQWLEVLLCLVALICTASSAVAQIETGLPTLAVSGGFILPDSTRVPNLFGWGQAVLISGAHWNANETLQVHIVGPINLPGVTSRDIRLGSVITDSSGNMSPGLNTAVLIPSIHRLSGQPDTPRPGNYQVYAISKPNSRGIYQFAYAFYNLNLAPTTIPAPAPFPNFILWAKERGGRDGQLGGQSPERTDPEWVSVWDERPVAIYATVTEADIDGNSLTDGGNQSAFISHEEYPGTHYAHDVNLELAPDLNYTWVLSDSNFNADRTKASTGRLEWEWEAQNSGSPYVGSYGHGTIGLPPWATPSAGDRVYTVGRWTMDNGHPDSGDRTEIHPARMLATMRKRNTAIPFFTSASSPMTRASQVDIYVSGNGGGANHFPDALSSTLNQQGVGGASILDVLSGGPLQTYFDFGPADSTLVDLLTLYLGGDPSLINAVAGPSGLGWVNGPIVRPINDMDYDFDVPLPVAPAGAAGIQVQVTTHPEHSTAVKEVITYTNQDSSGLPTVAHIHLPYLGADNGIYARTLKFHWDVFNPPGKHFVVSMDDITFFLNTWMSGRVNMWTDISGQWVFLSEIDPHGFLNATETLGSSLTGRVTADVYLDPTDTLRVFSVGYDQEDFEALFGVDIGKSAYSQGVDLAEATAAAKLRTFDPTRLSSASDGENVDLGGAIFQELPSTTGIVGEHINTSSTGYFYQDFNVSYVPAPPRIGVTGLPADFGRVCLGSSLEHRLHISNLGEGTLTVTGLTVSGPGFSVVPSFPLPFGVAGGVDVFIDISVFFSPTDISQGAGTVTIFSNDPIQPSITFNLTGTVGHPTIQATANTSRTPTLVVGSSTTWPVTITNPGTCTLRVKPSISGSGFTFVLPSSYYIYRGTTLVGISDIVVPPGGSNTDLVVKFVTPSVASKFVGTLTLASNDPVNPATTLVFGAEGVPVGMRVLVVDARGVPYPIVDRIKLTSEHQEPKVDVRLKDVHLTTIDPPNSWQRIQYHYMTALAPTDGSNDYYEIKVRVGKKSQSLQFTLGSGEFKQIVITIP